MGEAEKWIALNNVPNLGPRRIATVYRQVGSLDCFFSGKAAILSELLHLKTETVRSMLKAVDLQQGVREKKACQQRGIGRVDDRVDGELGDVTLDHFDARHGTGLYKCDDVRST